MIGVEVLHGIHDVPPSILAVDVLTLQVSLAYHPSPRPLQGYKNAQNLEKNVIKNCKFPTPLFSNLWVWY